MNGGPSADERMQRILDRAHHLLARRVYATAAAAVLATLSLVVVGDTARVELHNGSPFPAKRSATAVAGEDGGVATSVVEPPGPTTTAPRSAELAAPASVVARYDNGVVVVSWTPASGAPAPVHYVVRREPRATDATVTGGLYRDSGVRIGTTYRYEIAGVDAEGAESPPAFVVVALVGPAPASLAAVAGVRAEVLPGSTHVRVRWTPSASDDVHHYIVHRDGVALAHVSPSQSEYLDGGIVVGATYVYDVEARDGAGNRSPRSAAAKVAIPPADRNPPTAPRDLVLAVQCVCSEPNSLLLLRLRWLAATDDVGVTAYRVYRNGAPLATLEPSAREYFDNITRPPRGDKYVYVVRAIDGAGNVGPTSNPAEYAEPG